MCSVNKARHTASLLRAEFERRGEAHLGTSQPSLLSRPVPFPPAFANLFHTPLLPLLLLHALTCVPTVLNIVSSDLAEKVLQVGACHSDKLDKWSRVGLTKCTLDWSPWPLSASSPDTCAGGDDAEVPCVLECIAHLRCVVTRMDDSWCEGHWLLGARIDAAAVKQAYWSGTQLVATHTTLSPPLSFLGSQRFAAITPFALEPTSPPDGSTMTAPLRAEERDVPNA